MHRSVLSGDQLSIKYVFEEASIDLLAQKLRRYLRKYMARFVFCVNFSCSNIERRFFKV